MSAFGNALAGAVGAVANVGAQGIDQQMKLDQQIAAEQRAANLQLDLHTRMAAADEMQKNRALERFATLTKGKMGDQVPVDPASIQNPSLTDASATEITPRSVGGASDDEEGDDSGAAPVRIAFHGDKTETVKQMQAILDNPKATPEQKQDAQNVIDGIKAQTKKQQQLDAQGKTRPRTVEEARDAAFEDAAQNDPAAYVAGQSMWKQAMQDDRSDEKDDRTAAEKKADRESHEKIARMTVDQRAQAAAARDATAQKRIEALAGGKGAKATALMQNYNFMTSTMGKSPEEAQRLLFQAKDSSELEKVFKLMLHDKYGELSTDDALAKVRGIEKATGGTPTGGKQVPAAGKTRTWNTTTGKLE